MLRPISRCTRVARGARRWPEERWQRRWRDTSKGTMVWASGPGGQKAENGSGELGGLIPDRKWKRK
jgi:hypothetical protein